jgi:membrane-associated protein
MSFHDLLDPEKLITTFGLVGIIIIIFLESGIFFGFFFPGDSLLFTAGFLASQGFLPIAVLTIGVFVAAVLGDSVGYWFGRKTGPKLFTKDDSFFFKKKYAVQAENFYEKHGKKTIILAQNMPN